jgi:hypothetical protein
MTDTESKRRWLLFGLSCVFVAAPYLVVTYPPSTDLAQHVAQVRLFFEHWENPQDGYRVQWTTPYNLGYILIAVFYKLFGPLAAGRAALLTVALAWTAAIHYLAARRRLPVAAAVFATIFVFNFTFYWGFYTFVFGWPFFVVWLILTTEPDTGRFELEDGLKLLATALALYFSHALWFAAAVGWLAISLVVQRPSRRTAVLRVASAAPAVLLAAVWYVRFASTWYASNEGTFDRGGWRTKVNWAWWVDTALGGISSDAEIVIVVVAILWIAAALVRHRRNLREAVNVPLAACALMFAAAALLAPYNYQNTIFFAERWMPFAFILGLLAVPLPLTLPRLATLQAATAAALGAFCLSTALLWTRYEAIETTGLSTAVEALPPGARVLGLDYIKLSTCIKSYAFMHLPVYGQVMKGATPNFSFAEFPHSLVVYDTPGRFEPPWTRKLDWFADHAVPADFGYFDYAIINADDESHRHIPERFPVVPVTTAGRWRLYKTISSS